MRKNQTPSEPMGVALEIPAEPAPIALVMLALELGEYAEVLAARLRADVFVDEATGLRCISVETCKRVIDERDAGERRRADAQRANEQRMAALYPQPLPPERDEWLDVLAARGLQGVQR